MDSGTARPFLLVLGESNSVQTVPIRGSSLRLGRDRSLDVFIDHITVSRTHAEILRDVDGYRLHDLDSKNGTSVNHQSIKDVEHRLRDGDEIRLGASGVVLIFRDVPDSLPTEGSRDQKSINQTAGLSRVAGEAEGGSRTTESVIWDKYRSTGSLETDEPNCRAENEMYAGNVKLKVALEGDPQQLPNLTDELRRDPKLVLLDVRTNSPKDAEILLTLWEPLPLLKVLAGFDVVSQVSSGGPSTGNSLPNQTPNDAERRERVVMVWLSDQSGRY